MQRHVRLDIVEDAINRRTLSMDLLPMCVESIVELLFFLLPVQLLSTGLLRLPKFAAPKLGQVTIVHVRREPFSFCGRRTSTLWTTKYPGSRETGFRGYRKIIRHVTMHSTVATLVHFLLECGQISHIFIKN